MHWMQKFGLSHLPNTTKPKRAPPVWHLQCLRCAMQRVLGYIPIANRTGE